MILSQVLPTLNKLHQSTLEAMANIVQKNVCVSSVGVPPRDMACTPGAHVQ